MLDTNTFSYILRGRSTLARTKLATLRGNEVACISAITEAELHYGIAKRNNMKLKEAVQGLLHMVAVLPWRSEEAKTYGELRAKQENSGKPLGDMDILIAAHSIAVGATLVTSDAAFRQVSDLYAITDWATDL